MPATIDVASSVTMICWDEGRRERPRPRGRRREMRASARTRGIRSSIAAGPKSRKADSSETPPASGVTRNGPSSSNPESNGAPSSSNLIDSKCYHALVDSFSDRLRQYVGGACRRLARLRQFAGGRHPNISRGFDAWRRIMRSRLRTCRRSSPAIPRRLPRGPTPSSDRRASRGNPRRSRASSPPSRQSAALQRRRGNRPPGSADPATRVVITGQQAGLFGGPLFTLLKAITTMKLAAQVSTRTSRSGRAGVLDRCGGSRLAGSQRMYGARQRVRTAHGAARRSAGRRIPARLPG